MKKLHQLISEKESELQNLEDSLGLGFPIVEQVKMVQISHLQLELEDLRQIEDPYQLNDNQQIVLEWLKLTASTGKPMQVVFWMMNNAAWGHLDELRDPLMELTDKQQFEVLTAFAQWGLEQEEKE
ncbi:TPA: hypothetical protein ONV50_002707 [Enterococcus faecium]|jgi:hypothetical protein|uniref:DUF1642 domain-containing protein n=1 Tax=Enterococcus faecium TaxID=1352 RepID=A0AAW8RLB4_ENTFC|nr:hypothetical protein [Enterococcus faecium]MBQ1103153.1 hypothetical protein [Enterococcus faecium]MBQ1127138.1 hypothetical protein [Enterococcus faecium]MBQ1129686.1 hypothetical protein [Enterococcus faecium]MBQ1129794.1 hypothetical protein [Enterococcus faecium]MBQ1133135.1 hypothetical protein [Enterococcus faecium]